MKTEMKKVSSKRAQLTHLDMYLHIHCWSVENVNVSILNIGHMRAWFQKTGVSWNSNMCIMLGVCVCVCGVCARACVRVCSVKVKLLLPRSH